MSSFVWGPESFRGRVAVALASTVAYAGAFAVLHTAFGLDPIALSALLLLVGGSMFGVRGGFVAWLVVVPLNVVLHLAMGLGTAITVGQNPVRVAVALGIGLVVGRLRDVSLAFEHEAIRREAESLQRARAETQLRLSLAAIPDVMLRLSRDGTFLEVHAGNNDDLPVPPERLHGSLLTKTMPAAFAASVLPAMKETLDTGLPHVAEYQLTLPRGAQDYEARMVAFGPDEVFAIIRNTTENKRLAEVLRQREREQAELRIKEQLAMSERHAALGTLAAGVAHEINNPLAYVISNLGYVGQELKVLVAEIPRESLDRDRARLSEMKDAIDEAVEGAQRVRVIVRNLKTFTRGDDDKTELVDVRVELDNALNMAKKEIAHRARLVQEYAPVAMVRANPGRVSQVFLNLLINATQAIREGAAAKNEVRAITRMDGTDAVVIEVHDTGSGIPAEVRAHLFEPFFTTKPVGTGTGLGLYICRNLITAMGGTITVESIEGRGSVFRMRLPAVLEARPAAPVPVPPASPQSSRRGRVIVVDDEPVIGKAVSRILGEEHDVVVVGSAQSALDRIKAGERFEVILCDLMMPEMTGMDLYQELTRTEVGQRDRMVFFSGGVFSPTINAFLREIPNAKIDKPFDSNQLRLLIRERVRAAQ